MLRTQEEYYCLMLEAVAKAWRAADARRRLHYLAVARMWRMYAQIAGIAPCDSRRPPITKH